MHSGCRQPETPTHAEGAARRAAERGAAALAPVDAQQVAEAVLVQHAVQQVSRRVEHRRGRHVRRRAAALLLLLVLRWRRCCRTPQAWFSLMAILRCLSALPGPTPVSNTAQSEVKAMEP